MQNRAAELDVFNLFKVEISGTPKRVFG